MKTFREIFYLTKQAYFRQDVVNPKEAAGPLPLHLQALSRLHLFHNPDTKTLSPAAQFPANALAPQSFATGYVWSLPVEV